MTTNEFEKKLDEQVNLNKIGIYEVFVNNNELAEYWGLEKKAISINQKMYVAVFDGERICLSFARSRAIRNLLDEAGVNSFEELEELYN